MAGVARLAGDLVQVQMAMPGAFDVSTVSISVSGQ